MLPLSKPVIAVVGLYTAVNHWNDWFAGAFYVNDTKLWPVQTVLQQMLTKAMNSQQEVTSVAQALAHNTVSVTSEDGSSCCYKRSDSLCIPVRAEILCTGRDDRCSERLS